ncbi:hypothetical protein [Akkermansia sp.]|uniref:hypothetical protein n=1 Tax=Akkermansia sp. TaxID=1872421 RepID=UPI00266BA9C3|nr:hypothetical protein [uncultured Akkermansia sp.]
MVFQGFLKRIFFIPGGNNRRHCRTSHYDAQPFGHGKSMRGEKKAVLQFHQKNTRFITGKNIKLLSYPAPLIPENKVFQPPVPEIQPHFKILRDNIAERQRVSFPDDSPEFVQHLIVGLDLLSRIKGIDMPYVIRFSPVFPIGPPSLPLHAELPEKRPEGTGSLHFRVCRQATHEIFSNGRSKK